MIFSTHLTLFLLNHVLASAEGAYRFAFAENRSIHQFLYSRLIFKRRWLHTWRSVLKDAPKYSNLQRFDNSDNFTIRPNDNFEGCLEYYNYDITTRHHGSTAMTKYISCIILNGDPGICEWKWITEDNSFIVTLNRTDFNSTKVEPFQKYGIGRNDVFGVIRCKLADNHNYRDVIFDLPFVSYQKSVVSSPEALNHYDKPTISVVLALASIIVVGLVMLILVWNYRRRKQRLSRAKEKILR